MNQTKILKTIKGASFRTKNLAKLVLYQIDSAGNPDEEKMFLKEWVYKIEDVENFIATEIHDTSQGIADDFNRKSTFLIQGMDKNKTVRCQHRIQQIPERTEIANYEPTAEGLVGQALRQTEVAFNMASELLQKQSDMQRDLMDQYHKRMNSLEKREDMMSEILQGYKDLNMDQEEKARKDDRIDKLIDTVAGVFAPAAAQKLVDSGILTPEAGAMISATGKDIAEGELIEATEPTNGQSK